ncbi:MAG TPA: hypothetical protein EYP24_01440 [bacterium (Candidatus Stahlbacteria)]|nr:hypothetical protein [Candidatus Stahlbacteria bacterium]
MKRGGIYFLAAVLLIHIVVGIIDYDYLISSLRFSFRLSVRIGPVIISVFFLIFITNYLITPDLIKKHLGQEAGIRRWLIAIGSGAISTGPIFLWYPILKRLHNGGVSYGFLATFLYCRAIKPPLFPLLVVYFGLKLTLILTAVMICYSIIIGVIFEINRL